MGPHHQLNFTNFREELCLFGGGALPAAAYWSLNLNRQCEHCRAAKQLRQPLNNRTQGACASAGVTADVKASFDEAGKNNPCQFRGACQIHRFVCCRRQNGKCSYTRSTKIRCSRDWPHHRGHQRETSASTRKKTGTGGKEGGK